MSGGLDVTPLEGARSVRIAVIGVVLGAVAIVGLLVAAVVAWDGGADPPPPPQAAVFVADLPGVAALAPLPEGGLLAGERLTGRIVAVGPDGARSLEPVAVVDTRGADDDQRGLVGLVVDPDAPERVFAAWTRATDGRLVVGQVAPGPERLMWVGPESSDLANGGHLAWREGRLVIGIGDLQDRSRLDDPSAPNGKVVALDPDAGPGQAFEVLSSGWNNPFALAVAPGGEVWVADNAGRSGFERFGRGDTEGRSLTDLTPADEPIAPSGLVVLGERSFGVCGYVGGQLVEVVLDGGAARLTGRVLAERCRLGVAALADGRLVVSTGDALLTVPAP